MLALEADGRYADLLELEIYNAALAGMQLDGKRFFYVNPLEVDPALAGKAKGYEHVLIQRPQWHACACCPPNLARLIASLGGYLWSEDESTVYSHLFVGSVVSTRDARIAMESGYPWNGRAVYTIEECTSPFELAIHIPVHAQNLRVHLNGLAADVQIKNGYAYIRCGFAAGEQIEVCFDMPPRRIHTHPLVRDTAGKVALARGPIVYCFEGVDNRGMLKGMKLPEEAKIQVLPYDQELLGGIVPLEAYGLRAIPYYAWSNRGENAMTVFVQE